MIRGLCWPPLLSLAVQKGTNWQWANESPLSLSGAQLPPLHSGPPFSLPLLCLPSFIYFPSSCVFAPSRSPSFPFFRWPASGSSSVDCGLAQNAIRLTKAAPPIRSGFLILTVETHAVALSLCSFRLMRRRRQEITSGEPEQRFEYQMRERGLSEARRLKDRGCSQAGNCLFAIFFYLHV